MQLVVVLLCLTAFGFKSGTGNEKIIDVKVPASKFTTWLEYEVYTVGEQNISVSITNSHGKVFFQEDRTLYGEAYLNLDTSEFPKGVYDITVICGANKANVSAEKI
jgi:hypothetical protein